MWHAIARYELKQGGAGAKLALVVDEALYDIGQLVEAGALGVVGKQPRVAADLNAALANWDAAAPLFSQMAQALPELLRAGRVAALAPQSYTIDVPYTPGRIFGAASNFYEHAREMGTELAPREESAPFCFMKAETSITATDTDVVMPADTEKLDWEVELGVIIGKTCRNVSVEEAYDYIAGYTVFNDVTARDLNRRSDYPFKHDWFRGKSHDTFGPIGPWMVPRACIERPQGLRMQLSVNGEMMQDDTADAMIFNIAEQIAYLSGMLTLKPGDLLATGTPNGVGMGRGVYLKPGDEMVATIESIGSIRNRVVAAPARKEAA
ncbi:fumarylacetoacetate hydrolase family protein [Pseudoduganella aquatica]|uniref:FAA hydrolase family protein n=1 Tax=Pseudoduganella aquatica TaxID=2660641 RepID=A0A7X4HHE3_9BURK|nr:fumarylacetoacetate hydrolase family protein [Pseudoduganella aquatica]MYN10808.1 FAA hydrolase family protein [Pseudoduganella aquatica]